LFNGHLRTPTQLPQVAKCNNTQSFVLRSADGGVSWSTPADGNLTNLFAGQPWQMMQFGEGMGLVLPDRLLTCGWIGTTLAANGGVVGYAGVQCIKSTDDGKTWVLAGLLPAVPNELEPVEPAIAVLRNGSVLLNMRDNLRSHRRWEALSNDCGDTFSAPWKTAVVGPTSNAALITLSGPVAGQLLLADPPKVSGQVVLANPRSTTSRVNLSLYTLNQGDVGGPTEWKYIRTITQGGSAYVTSTQVADPSSVGLLFETGSLSNPYQSINYLVVDTARGAL
jgi:hypothetical protein